MEEWKTYKLGDIVDVKGGKRLPKGISLISSPNSHPYIKIRDLGKSRILNINSSYEYVDNETQVKIAKYTVNAGDVILSIVGTIGLTGIIGQSLDKANLTENCIKFINLRGISSRFLYYYLSSTIGQFYIKKGIVGAVQPKLPIKNIQDINILLPSPNEQNRIVSILSALDSKIELNNRINHNLEEQEQALYKSWFVDFEPFKDGKFVESELGMIPEGWRVVTMGEVTTEIRTKVGNRTGIKVLSPINTGKLALSEEYFTKQVFSNSIAKYILVEPNSFAYNPARVNIGSIGMNEFPFDGCVSPVYVVFRCEDEYEYLFDFFRKGERFKTEVITRSIGGVRQTLAYKDFSMIKMVYPPAHIIRNFNSIYHTFYRKINDLENQNKKISELRDSILPKLMSGELKINEIDC